MKRVSPATKMRVLGAIEFAPGPSIKAKIDHISTLVFKDEEGEPLQFTWRTIQTWYSRYKKDGITTMKPKPRSDRGKARKVEPELVQEAIDQMLPLFRGPTNLASIYRACIENNLLQRERVAPNTFRRIVARYDMLKATSETENKARLAFSKAHANQLWQADTMCGPYVNHQGKNLQAKLIAFIDDASRVCCHGQFFAAENTDTLLIALKSALYKRGVPECLYVDNGSIYASKELGQVCGRLGCVLSHAPVRDGAAKGKVERFFRTVRLKFLTRQLDLTSIDTLNRAFFRWMEDEYNSQEHSTIGMKPIDRFGLDLKRVRFLPPHEVNEELFFVEETRKVLADNTFNVKKVRLEAPRDLRSRTIEVRFDRQNFGRVIVYFKGERMGEARAVDFIANDRAAANSQKTSEETL
jgi:putative transposase